MMIKRTADTLREALRESKMDANKYLENLIIKKSITDVAVERLEVSLENIINMTCARLKNKFGSDCVMYDRESLAQAIDDDVMTATKSFFACSVEKLKSGIHATSFVKMYTNFMKSHDLEPLKEQQFRDFVKQYCNVTRIIIDAKSVNGYVLAVDPKFTVDERYTMDSPPSMIPLTTTPPATSEQIVNEYINYPDVKEKLASGYNTDAFKNTFDIFSMNKYHTKVVDYKSILCRNCIQAYVDNKKTKFIFRNSDVARAIIDDANLFLQSIDESKTKNKTELLNLYREWCKNKPQLTKDSFLELVNFM